DPRAWETRYSARIFMALVTLRVVDGADRGRVFQDIATPLTIGREEGNSVQLNDERVSRFHVKIQDDQDKVVLTDLQSTNGTKVNGETVHLWVLRAGDVVTLGRTVLIVGSRDEIATRLAQLRGADMSGGVEMDPEGGDPDNSSCSFDFELHAGDPGDGQTTLHTLLPPELPDDLTLSQAAQLSELLQYFHLRMRGLIHSVQSVPKSDRITLEQRQWQNLLDLYERLATYARSMGEPER
ncbi:MAG: FHA domain-containing protein, partial [Thermoguttaceae bacterium]